MNYTPPAHFLASVDCPAYFFAGPYLGLPQNTLGMLDFPNSITTGLKIDHANLTRVLNDIHWAYGLWVDGHWIVQHHWTTHNYRFDVWISSTLRRTIHRKAEKVERVRAYVSRQLQAAN